jgi:hypothetical protein
LKPGDKTFKAGRLGELQIVNGSQILLGKPTIFTKDNIEKFDFWSGKTTEPHGSLITIRGVAICWIMRRLRAVNGSLGWRNLNQSGMLKA